jgi:hypothetical protein
MKKIITPKQHEEASYFSDFSGQPFCDLLHPPVELTLKFNYGSEYDQSEITFHLSDKDVSPIIDLISSKLNPDYKKDLEGSLDENIDNMHEALDSRDPLMCEYYISCNNLIKRFLGPKND